MQREDYIVTARAKGVPPWRILLRHALPNSMFGLITLVGLNLGTLIGATAIIEPIFSLPGVGAILVQSISDHDVPVVEGIVVVFAVVVVVANLLADILYAVLDPRIRYGRVRFLTCWSRPRRPGRGRRGRRAAAGWARALRLWVPAGFLILLAAACFIWPQIYPVPNPVGGSVLNAGLPPLSPGHIFGTDPVGNDVFSRILYGGQVSFEVGFAVTAIGLVVGGLLGMIAGYWGGAVDAVISRVLDVLIAFPALVLALVIAEGLGPSEVHVIWALSVFSIPAFGRIARSATLALREQTFMLAARLSGTRRWRMIARHIVPNIAPQLLTFSLLGFGVVIILEGALSFLGLGIPLPEASWGSMIAQGQQTLSASPDLVLIPSAFLFATVLSLNLLGDALRERWAI